MTFLRAKRRFVGVVRTGGSLRSIRLEAKDELSATMDLQARYGTENIIEVRGFDGNKEREQMSQAEADVRKRVMLGLPKALYAVVAWVLRGSFGK